MINPWNEEAPRRETGGPATTFLAADANAGTCGCLARAQAEHSDVQHMLMYPAVRQCRPVVRLVNGYTRRIRMDARCGQLMHVADGGHYVTCSQYRRAV